MSATFAGFGSKMPKTPHSSWISPITCFTDLSVSARSVRGKMKDCEFFQPICLQMQTPQHRPDICAVPLVSPFMIIIHIKANVNDFCIFQSTILHFRQNFSFIKVFSRKVAQKRPVKILHFNAWVRRVQLDITTCIKFYDLY